MVGKTEGGKIDSVAGNVTAESLFILKAGSCFSFFPSFSSLFSASGFKRLCLQKMVREKSCASDTNCCTTGVHF